MRNTILLLALLALAGCDGGGTTSHDAVVTGKWLYRGTVGGCPINAVLALRQDGSVVTATVPPLAADCSGSNGFFALPADSSITLSGRVHGDSLTFTLRAWGSELVHTAAVAGDSMSGVVTGAEWVASHAGPDGTFGARRYTTQVLPDRFLLVLSGAVNDTLEGSTYANQFGPVFNFDDRTVAGGLTKDVYLGAGFPFAPGTYHVYDRTVQRDSLSGAVFYHGATYRFRDGTATITGVANGFLEGTLEVDAYRSTNPSETVHVRGGFHPHYFVAE